MRGTTYPDGDTVGTPADPIRYDAAGRLAYVPGIVSALTYNAAGRATHLTNVNGTATTRAYSSTRGFLEHITTTAGATTIQDLAYDLDPAGMALGVTSPFANESWTYAYDDLHRVIAASSPSDSSLNQTWTFDEIGRTTFDSRVGAYTYNSSRPYAPATVAGSQYLYDFNGNLTSGGGRTIQWTVENQPSQIGDTLFAYDGAGSRLKKTTGTSTSLYPVGDDYEVTNGVATKYVSVTGLGVIAKRVGSQTFWLHTDRLGSIQAITDGAGSVALRRSYRTSGDKIGDVGSMVESRGHTGERQDAETGLTYLHARYYDPVLGVFLSPDPSDPSQPGVGLDPYAYVLRDPINATDHSGLIIDGDMDGGGCYYMTITYPDGSQWSGLNCPGESITVNSTFPLPGLSDEPQPFNPARPWIERPIYEREPGQPPMNRHPLHGSAGPIFFIEVSTTECKVKCGSAIPAVVPGDADIDLNRSMAAQHPLNLWWYYTHVRNDGPWNYKRSDPKFTRFGNFNAGATGHAASIPDIISKMGAGWYQILKGAGSLPSWHYSYGPPWGDDPGDVIDIENGQAYDQCMTTCESSGGK